MDATLRSALRRAVPVLTGAAILLALAPSLVMVAGYRALVVRTGSMEPALMAGDAIVTHLQSPSSVRVGDVVTFADPTRGNALVTHRVSRVVREGETYTFVTRGEGNREVERWSIGDRATVGRLALRIPKLGFAVAWTSAPPIRAVVVGLAFLLLTVWAIRRIWSPPTRS